MLSAAVPADDARRNLVAERQDRDRRMAADRPHLRGEVAADGALQRVVVEKCDVLRPRQPDHDAQAAAGRFVEQIGVRRRVGADRIDAEIRHQAKVPRHLRQRRKLIARRVGREGAVGHAFDQEARRIDAQKFPVGGDARAGDRRPVLARLRTGLNGGSHNCAGCLLRSTAGDPFYQEDGISQLSWVRYRPSRQTRKWDGGRAD